MKIVVQRVLKASVEIDQKRVGSIQKGVCVFLGIAEGDTSSQGKWLAEKLASLRMFPNEEGKLDRSVLDISGEVLVISQFTLYGDCSSGRRPSFTRAARPEIAISLYEDFITEVQKQKIFVQTGVFGAKMEVSLINDGPFTLVLEK